MRLVKIRYFQPQNSDIAGNPPRWVTAVAEIDPDGWLSEVGHDGRSLFQNGCCHNHLGRYQAQIIRDAKADERLNPDEYQNIED